jgi:hypothetical protein
MTWEEKITLFITKYQFYCWSIVAAFILELSHFYQRRFKVNRAKFISMRVIFPLTLSDFGSFMKFV